MLNKIHTAISAFRTANAAIPVTAPDGEMDTAVHAAGDALDRVIRIPALNREDALAKLAFAVTIKEWDTMKGRLIERAQGELLAALHRER